MYCMVQCFNWEISVLSRANVTAAAQDGRNWSAVCVCVCVCACMCACVRAHASVVGSNNSSVPKLFFKCKQPQLVLGICGSLWDLTFSMWNATFFPQVNTVYVFNVICRHTEIFLHLASFIYFLLLTTAVIAINEHFICRIWVAHTLEWRESAVVPGEGSFQLFIPLPEIGNCDVLVVFFFFIHSFILYSRDLSEWI